MHKRKLTRTHSTHQRVRANVCRACNARRREVKLACIIRSVLCDHLSIAAGNVSIEEYGWFMGIDSGDLSINLHVRHKHATA